jgi:hypothetical protein
MFNTSKAGCPKFFAQTSHHGLQMEEDMHSTPRRMLGYLKLALRLRLQRQEAKGAGDI